MTSLKNGPLLEKQGLMEQVDQIEKEADGMGWLEIYGLGYRTQILTFLLI